MVENLNGGSPSQDPRIRGLYHKLQFETIPIEDRIWEQVTFPDEVKGVPLGVLRAAVNGDVDAYGDIYEIYEKKILHYFRTKVSIDWAEDCAQELWTRVYNKLPRYEFIGIPFHHYLFAAAHHISINWWRAQRHEDSLPDADFNFFARMQRRFDQPEEVVELRETFDEVKKHLESLKPEQSTVIVDHYLHGISHEETSREIGKSAGAVRQIVVRGMRALRKKISKRFDKF